MSVHTYANGYKGRGKAVHIVRVWDDAPTTYTLCDGTGWARVRLTNDAPTCKRCLAILESEAETTARETNAAIHAEDAPADTLAAQRDAYAARYFGIQGGEVILDGRLGEQYNDYRLTTIAVQMGWQAPEVAPVDTEESDYDAAEALDYVNDIGETYGIRLDWVDGDLIASRIYETLTICACCMSMLANGDRSSCRDYYGHADGEGEEHPRGLCAFAGNPWQDGWHFTPGIMTEEHATGCPVYADAWAEVQCECAIDDCSLATCDGCGAYSGGYAYRELVTATKYAPHDAR